MSHLFPPVPGLVLVSLLSKEEKCGSFPPRFVLLVVGEPAAVAHQPGTERRGEPYKECNLYVAGPVELSHGASSQVF